MQEEVNQKTVALSIRTTKLTGKVLAAALGKVVRALQKHHRKALTPQGRQSVQKYSAKVLNKEQDKASILGQLRKFTEQIRTQAKEKQRTREAVKDGR